MLTLTTRNRPAGGLAKMLALQSKSFDRLRKSAVWRRCVTGAVAVFECTYTEERGWHAHLHVALEGKYVPWHEVLAVWQRVTGGEGQRIDLRGQRWPKAAAVRYLSKYASKGVALAELPDRVVDEFVDAWWKFRTLRTYGTARRPIPEREPWDGVVRCPECGKPGEEIGNTHGWVGTLASVGPG